MSQRIENTSQRSKSMSQRRGRMSQLTGDVVRTPLITTEMHAVLVKEDQSLTWSKVPAPVPKTGEILIDVHATALNRADLMQRAGNYPPPPGWPEWMGLEVAGVVAEVPGDCRWKIGDRVCALPEAFATSHLNLCIEGGMKAGDTVLIQAGSSGLGIAAIQLVKALGGKVMTMVSTEEKAEFVHSLGADIVINRTVDDLGTAMEEHPVDIALDCISGSELGQHIEKMAIGGRWIVIATLGGAMTQIDMNTFFRRGIKLIGSTLRSRPSEMKAEILAELEKTLWQSLSFGAIKPVIYKTLPITQAEEAHAILQRRENIGKVVLTVENSSL